MTAEALWKESKQSWRTKMMTKIMPYLWRWNNWVDKKITHIKAWFTAAIDGEWDDDLDDDIIEKMWKARCKG